MRARHAVTVLATAALTITALPAASAQAELPAASAQAEDSLELTLLATTDVHGHVYDWDYFAGKPYPEDDSLGLTRVASIVKDVEAEKGEDSVLLLDNGDAIQGTPLTSYYGLGEGLADVLTDRIDHPMATAFNTLGYDAQVVGNHEYNYDLPLLAAYEEDLEAPLLGANVIDVDTGEPYHEPYTLIDRTIDGEEVTVGVIGLVTPGVRVWDRAFVEGELEFQDVVETAKKWVPVVEQQADVVVVLAHTGQGQVPSADYDPADLTEDAVNNIAELVPGIDVIVAGHTHQDEPQTVFTNTAGEQVLVTQPNYWARSITETTLNLVPDVDGEGWAVDWSEGNAPTAVAHYATEATEEDPELADALREEHETTVAYVNTPVTESVTKLTTETSRYEDTPILDFINHVQALTVEEALAGTEYDDLPVLSHASPFSRTAVFPEGQVTIRDIAGLYTFDNTLMGVELTGAQVKDYLEWSASYFKQVEEGAEFDGADVTNAVTPARPEGVPDYAYDALSGVEYYIDISEPAGERIKGLSHPDGTPVADDDLFVLAINNYRASGGAGFPHVADAPVVYDERLEIRQLLIDWASENGIDPADFFVENWWLVSEYVAEPGEPADRVGFFLNDGWDTAAEHEFMFGRFSDEVLIGDFDGDGTDSITVRRGSTFYVSNAPKGGPADEVFTYGRPGDTVVVGDWDGDGRDTLAVRRGNVYHVKNTLTGGPADVELVYGRPGDQVVVGDWDGNASDTFAVRRGASYFVKNTIAGGPADTVVVYGRPGDVTLAGDWDGDGTDTFAVRRGAEYFVKNSITPGNADIHVVYGRAGDEVYVGDWNGDNTDTLGVRRMP